MLLEKRYEGIVSSVQEVSKVDLEMNNHLSGKMATYIKLSFRTISVNDEFDF